MARPGRKRKAGRREPNGRISRQVSAPAERFRDAGTDELAVRRQWWATFETSEGEVVMGDVTKTSYPLGVLLLNGSISEDQHRAACRYAWLYSAALGRSVHVTAVAFDRLPGGDDDPSTDQRRAAWMREFKAASAIFSSRKMLDAVVNLAVYERTPRWMRPQVPRVTDMIEAWLAIQGFRLLAEHFGQRRLPEKRMAA